MSRQVDLDDLTADDVLYMRQRPWLITEAKLRGVDNIEELMAAAVSGDSAETAAESTAEFVSPAPVDYSKKPIGELRKPAEARGLSTDGSKKDLASRLGTHDAISSTTSAEAAGAVKTVVTEGETEDGGEGTGEPVTDTTPPPAGGQD